MVTELVLSGWMIKRRPLLSLIAHWVRLLPVNRCKPNGLVDTKSRKSLLLWIDPIAFLNVNAARCPSLRLARVAFLRRASSSFLSQRIFILVACAFSCFGSDRTRGIS